MWTYNSPFTTELDETNFNRLSKKNLVSMKLKVFMLSTKDVFLIQNASHAIFEI